MTCRRPGPTCRVKSKSKIDTGTSARTENRPPGPEGGLLAGWLDKADEWYQEAAEWAAESKSVEWVVRKLLRLSFTYSAKFFDHYLGESGEPITLDPVPADWQEAIRKNWKNSVKKKYRFKEPNTYRIEAYGWGNADLRNAVGHFNLTVTDEEFLLEDVYRFYYVTDQGQVVRHGPMLTTDNESGKQLQKMFKTLLPRKVYKNPYAKGKAREERFELKKEKDGWYLYVPTEWLLEHGKEFPVTGRFPAKATP